VTLANCSSRSRILLCSSLMSSPAQCRKTGSRWANRGGGRRPRPSR
jgi:hypothetical protein